MNIAHIIETALFILFAFLIGAILGYIIRCMFFRPRAAAAGAAVATGAAAVASASKPAPKSAPAPKPAAKPAAAPKPASAPKPKAAKPAPAKAPEAPKAAFVSEADADGKPIPLSGPRNGKKDDIKRIKGIGVKIEDTLNGLGIYHFDQIAGWSPKTVDWINGFISFKGRIEREKWIEQAKLLAEGKSTEFSKRVDKGEVPSSKK